jgi:hypothetical protein
MLFIRLNPTFWCMNRGQRVQPLSPVGRNVRFLRPTGLNAPAYKTALFAVQCLFT